MKRTRTLFFLLLLTLTAWAESSMLHVGQRVPDFTLTNQNSKSVHFSDFKGKVTLVTFLYTSCPYPDKCPMLADKLGKIVGLVDGIKGAKDKVEVISITLDPKRDTPQALKAYAQGHDKKGGHWTFLTGQAGDVQKVASLFGITYWTEKGIVEHNMATALVDKNGKLFKIWMGNDWKAGEMTAVIRDLLAE